ncbi:MAG: D-alanine--D-alanine ligase [Holophagales bacterium]|nr:D-alanine--D-alanine ligase [Holophagales bacterium]MYH26568.1 D-alanine--D-alanine ligase [Holophagales bacterium]
MARIAVLTGGSTPERTVALAGAAKVSAALRARGYEVTVFDTIEPGPLDAELERQRLGRVVGTRPPSLAELRELEAREDLPSLVAGELASHDAVFLVLHGRQGEGGEVQELLEAAGIAFTGSDARSSRLAMDKDESKSRFRDAGIPTPDWLTWPARQSDTEELGLPLIVKPSRVGSTVGLTLMSDLNGLDSAVGKALTFDAQVILERFLPGREYTVGVLEGEALGVGEIVAPGVIFDFHSKYTPGRARELFPAEIDPDLERRLRDLALAAHEALDLRDFSRVDFRLDAGGSAYCLEVNTLPGMTPTSLLPQSAAVFGISFEHLCDRMIRLALGRGPLSGATP